MFFLETRQHHAKRKKDEEKRERKRRIAARMIAEYMVVKSDYRHELAELKKDVVEYRETIKDLNSKYHDVQEYWEESLELIDELNDEVAYQKGVITAYEGVIDKFMANLK